MQRKITEAEEDRKYNAVLKPEVCRAVRQFYKGECQYCGTSGADHVDHIVARTKGGADNLKNYILACARCNQKKGNGDIAPQFLALITAIADRNKDFIKHRIRWNAPKFDFYIYRIGLSPSFYTSMIIHKKPTMEEYLRLRYLTDLYTEAKRLLQCKTSAPSPQTNPI